MATFLRYYLPVFLWGGAIFLLSGSEFGTKTTYRWLQAVVEHFFPDISVATIVKVNAMARKLAHVTEYFILGLLLWRALRREAVERWRRGWALGALAIGVLWASADETVQLFQPGRVASVMDVGLDTLGVLLAVLVIYGWSRRKGMTLVVPKTRQ
ncbi:MAG: VanZ family protein [Candidatus Acidoferrales bacterium]